MLIYPDVDNVHCINDLVGVHWYIDIEIMWFIAQVILILFYPLPENIAHDLDL